MQFKKMKLGGEWPFKKYWKGSKKNYDLWVILKHKLVNTLV